MPGSPEHNRRPDLFIVRDPKAQEPQRPKISPAIVTRAVDGDREAFVQIVEGTYQQVLGVAFALTGNLPDAEEVLQKTYVSALGAISRFRQEAAVETWLYRIATNTAKKSLAREANRRTTEHVFAHKSGRLRRGENKGTLEPVEERPEFNPHDGPLLDVQMTQSVRTALSTLSRGTYEAVVLRDIQGIPIPEIAAVLEIKEGTAKLRIHRGRIAMRESIFSQALQEAEFDLSSRDSDDVSFLEGIRQRLILVKTLRLNNYPIDQIAHKLAMPIEVVKSAIAILLKQNHIDDKNVTPEESSLVKGRKDQEVAEKRGWAEQLFKEGKSIEEIAATLGVSQRSVRRYLQNSQGTP